MGTVSVIVLGGISKIINLPGQGNAIVVGSLGVILVFILLMYKLKRK